MEPIYVGQKPFSEKTGTANVLRWGTGAVNIDGCRVFCDDKTPFTVGAKSVDGVITTCQHGKPRVDDTSKNGRWPANLCHDGSDEVVVVFPETGTGQIGGVNDPNGALGYHGGAEGKSSTRVKDAPGSAARFFFSAKADAHDRIGSKHPTVKPIYLMQWLCRLVTPPGGTVLDCFAGTGTTAESAYREGFNSVLIEREPEYQSDIRRRMSLILSGADERKRESVKARGRLEAAGPLFGEQ